MCCVLIDEPNSDADPTFTISVNVPMISLLDCNDWLLNVVSKRTSDWMLLCYPWLQTLLFLGGTTVTQPDIISSPQDRSPTGNFAGDFCLR